MTIQLSPTETLTRDASGRWTMIDTECPICNGPRKHAEVIDTLTRRGRKDLIHQIDPMHGFTA